MNYKSDDEVVAFVKSKRSSVVTFDQKLDIILLQSKIRLEKDKNKKKDGRGRKPKYVNPNERAAYLLSHSNNTVSQTWIDYCQSSSINLSVPWKRLDIKGKIPYDSIYDIRYFLRNRRLTQTRTVAKDVMFFLLEKGYLNFDTDNEALFKANLRNTQRFLKKYGYKRGHRKEKMSLKLSENLRVKRDEYVLKIKETSCRRVYLDESYIHHNYSRHRDSLYDPSDENYVEPIKKHKGRRYCFIAAIIDGDPNLENELWSGYDEPHLIEETLHIFEGGRTKDYHGMFNTTYFINWMEKLLTALEIRDIHNAQIIMDNARYHKSLPAHIPKKGNKKIDLIKYCVDNSIIHSPTESKIMMWSKIQGHISTFIKPTICGMAERAGHTVLFTPPYHSDLQPIELIWAITKGQVGREYDSNTSFREVEERLRKAFKDISSNTINGCIKKTEEIVNVLYNDVINEDENNDEYISEISDLESDTTSHDNSEDTD